MSKRAKTAISPTREENYPEWFQEVIKAADLAEHSLVRGCMVIKPWGYAVWEKMVQDMDRRFKEKGVKNAYFPLFIPLHLMQKEAKHVEGFATECAVVTHHRLEKNEEGKLVPAGELEEPLIVRPTSEMIIGETFAKWVSSYRDLPLLINQWANVVRWEMRTRLFLRTAEFLWQEGHTAHETPEDAMQMARAMHRTYAEFGKEVLAIPFYVGEKSERERFPGAANTYTIEGMMQDGKALQGGTSHYMHQNFSKASNIQFTNKEGQLEYAYTTSWGSTTRLIGAMLMTHSDDNGLILPPAVAPEHIVIIPFLMKEEKRDEVLNYCDALKKDLEKCLYRGESVSVIVDSSDQRAGEKKWNWVKKGVPIRVEVGPKEMEEGNLAISMRHKEEVAKISRDALVSKVSSMLEEMQTALYEKALAFRNSHTKTIHSLEDFEKLVKIKDNFPSFFIRCPWRGSTEMEEKIQKEYNVTIRCILVDEEPSKHPCPFSNQPDAPYALFARAY